MASSEGKVTELAKANSWTSAPILGIRLGLWFVLRNFSVGFFMIFVRKKQIISTSLSTI
jgi:hypothetical protein